MNIPPNINRNYRQPFPQPRQWNNYGPRGFHPQNQRPQYIRPPGSFPVNMDHWCETCDRGFATTVILENHKQQHQKCNIDGCQFIAHPKVITKHIQMQHSSGLFKKIAKLNNPHEIQKWRDERKKRYPTKENVEKKAAAMKEKIERGEKMGLNNGKRTRDNMSGSGYKRKQPFGAENNNKRKMFKSKHNIDNDKNQTTKSTDNNKDKLPIKDTPIKKDIGKNKSTQSQKYNNFVLKIEDKRQLQPFTGIQNLIELDDIDKNEPLEIENYIIEDDNDEVYSKVSAPKSSETVDDIQPTVCGALSSLMCDYGSSDEETKAVESIDVNVNTTLNTICARNVKNVAINTVPEHKINLVNKVSNEVSDKVSDDDSAPEEVKIVKQDIALVNEESMTLETANKIINKEVKKHKKEKYVPKKNTQTRPKPKVPSTLLQKLLHMEIRHERNIILQCIRYIVNNNYFDKKI